VAAIIIRQREDTEPEYRDSVRCERWEVVMPELVFEPKP
jgi:ATP-dependent DNA helicase RecQ